MGQTTPSKPIRRRLRRPAHDEHAYLADLASMARCEAERAVLELGALDVDPKHHDRVGHELVARRDRMLNEWEAAADEAGQPTDRIRAERVRLLMVAFRERVRELRYAAGPGGCA